MVWKGPSGPVFDYLGVTPKTRKPDKANGMVFKFRPSVCEGVSGHLPKMR